MVRRTRLARYKWYIVNTTDITNIVAYRKGFLTRALAREAIDAYLDKSLTLSILSGSEVMLNKIPMVPASFRIHKPHILRRDSVKDRISNYRKRERVKGISIIPHLFKRQWEPLPTEPTARKAFLKRGRDNIRNFILK